MEKWVEIRKSADFVKIANEFGISPISARILRNRDLITSAEIESYLSPGEKYLHNPMMHKGMDRVIFVLKEKIESGKRIRIIGDYDVDGICATYILYKGLTFFGAKADFVIPHRIEDGYGINVKLIKEAYDAGVDTIVTCDNGISAYDQTAFAHELNLTMIITDHHEVPYEEDGEKRIYKIPPADALVDPKEEDSQYPFKGICGAYISFQTICAYAHFLEADSDEAFLKLRTELLEFAALATVCDVMELRDENRSLVSVGTHLISNSRNLGMRALLHVTQMEGKTITPYHCGFILGPCLNASGRLDTSIKALELFLEDDENRALVKAEELRKLNDERKEMTLNETEKAFSYVEEKCGSDKVYVVYLPDCHESLAGIIAGRVRERFVHPTFVITKTEKGLKGSGRSIEAYDMFASLNEVKDCLTKFGGHKMAAGISLSEDNLELFRSMLNSKCMLSENDFNETVKIDMALSFEYADMKLANELRLLEPFGVGNEKPVFAQQTVTFISGTRIGKNRNVGRYKVEDGSSHIYELIYFGDLDAFEKYVSDIYDENVGSLLHSGNRINVRLGICYQIEINSFRGNDSVQLQLKHYR